MPAKIHLKSWLTKGFLPLLLYWLPIAVVHAQSSRPNFIFVMVDDLGWHDLSFDLDTAAPNPNKHLFHTPNLHRIAQEGMTFTDAYAPSAICTPSRRSIQFGMTPARQRGSHFQGDFEKGSFLAIPEVLKDIDSAYYCAHIGKWGEFMMGNIRYDSALSHPELAFGYDVSDGLTGNEDGGYIHGRDGWAQNFVLEIEEDPKSVFSTTSRTIDFMRSAQSQGRPFFVQLSHYSVHTAYRSTQEALDASQGQMQPNLHLPEEMIPMIRDLDQSIGMLLEAIDSLGLAGNTYLIVSSDNGGDGASGRSRPFFSNRNFPLRGTKNQLYEGGIRVPLFVRGPSVAQGTYNRTPVSLVDMLPTMATLADPSYRLGYAIDGRSWANCLHDAPSAVSRDLVWHRPYFHARTPASAIRVGDHKLIVHWDTVYGGKSMELYDLSRDREESHNLLPREWGKAAPLYNQLIAYLDTVHAELTPGWADFGLPALASYDSMAICQGDSVLFEGQVLRESGRYSALLATAEGQDSVVVLELTVIPTQFRHEAAICEGDSLTFGSQVLAMPGEYTETFPSANGCDSTVTLALTVWPAHYQHETAICEGDSLTFGTQTLTQAGTYTEPFLSTAGCDSIVTLTLHIVPPQQWWYETAAICDNDSLVFGTQVLREPGEYTETFPSRYGCDSIVVLTLQVLPTQQLASEATICQGDSLPFGTQVLTLPGDYTEVFQGANGCDSTVTLTLHVLPTPTYRYEASICQGDSVLFDSQILTLPGEYTQILQAANGCDSIVTLALNVLPTQFRYEAAICEGDSLLFGTRALTMPGEYTEVFPNANGCDSTVTLALTVFSTPVLSLENGLLAWTAAGDTSRVQYRPTPEGEWATLAVFLQASASEPRTFPANECGEYRILESSILCGDKASNIVEHAPTILANTPQFSSFLATFNQDGFSFYRIIITAAPEGMPDTVPVLLQVTENGLLASEKTMPLSRIRDVGEIDAFYRSCANYAFTLSMTHRCTTYLITRTVKSPVVNINISRLGSKALQQADTLDLRWSLATAEIANAGTAVAYYTVLAQETNQGGGRIGPEIALQVISDPAQVNSREARITTEDLRNAGMLTAGEHLYDRNFRFRIQVNLAGCGRAFSNPYHLYRCASFSLMAGCAPAGCPQDGGTAQSTARLSMAPEGREERKEGGLWDVTAYPNPTNGGFHLLVPEWMLEEGGLRLSVLNSAGQVLMETALQESGPTPFDFSGQPAGLYLLRLQRGEEVRSIKLLLE